VDSFWGLPDLGWSATVPCSSKQVFHFLTKA